MVADSATRLLDGTGKNMDLTLVLGPMKSGKSLELVSQMSPLAYSNVTHRVYQSDRHMRDDQVTSRIGGSLQTIKTHSLLPLLDDEHVEVVGVDEIHMFDVTDITALAARTSNVAPGSWARSLEARCRTCSCVRPELGPQPSGSSRAAVATSVALGVQVVAPRPPGERHLRQGTCPPAARMRRSVSS